MDILPATNKRIIRNTNNRINQRIYKRTLINITRYVGKSREEITKGIKRLDREWDIERVLETNASIAILISLGLGYFLSPYFLIVTAAIALFLLQHALQGWCPPLPIFRRMGVRTASEIYEEKTAMKLMRGDFRGYTSDPRELIKRANME